MGTVSYEHHGTTTLFAALNVLGGAELSQCMQWHHHREFIRFLNTTKATIPAGKLVHVILDNYGTHKHPKVLAWLGQHPCWTFHFTPSSGSWLNAVETLFTKLTERGDLFLLMSPSSGPPSRKPSSRSFGAGTIPWRQ